MSPFRIRQRKKIKNEKQVKQKNRRTGKWATKPMEYFKLLHLSKEPFSNSPDPAFFYASNQHRECIQKLEIALRLRRGLNVVTGEVGTGKTTLCRQLIQTFSGDSRISACLILDPDFSDPRSFLCALVDMMTGRKPGADETILDMKEALKHYLFQKGVEEDRIVVLIVDEGQKMPPACLETLRELLNFETNEYKLLQIIIFAQNEFTDVLNRHSNLADRINLFYRLGPLNFRDCRALIQHRLQNAVGPEGPGRPLFSLPAKWRIFRFSGGYPRKIIHLCHQCLLAMIIQNKDAVGWRLAGACARRTFRTPSFIRPVPVVFTLLLLMGLVFSGWHYSGTLRKAAHTIRSGWVKKSPVSDSPRIADMNAIADRPEARLAGMETPLKEKVSEIITANETAAVSPPAAEHPVEMPEEAPAADLLQATDSSKEAPAVLGRIAVTTGDTLGDLIHKIYGAYTHRYHQAVLDANPGLVNPDHLLVGQQLIFPALSVEVTNTPDSLCWIALSREPNFGAAVSTLRREADDSLPLRLLSSWTPEEGFVFRVVLKTCFEDRLSAELEKNRMASLASTPVEIVCPGKTAFFFRQSGEDNAKDNR